MHPHAHKMTIGHSLHDYTILYPLLYFINYP